MTRMSPAPLSWAGEVAARTVRVEIFAVEAPGPAGLATAFQSATSKRAGAMLVLPSPMVNSARRRIVELAVRNVIHGRPVRNTDALANPAALEHFRDRPELAS